MPFATVDCDTCAAVNYVAVINISYQCAANAVINVVALDYRSLIDFLKNVIVTRAAIDCDVGTGVGILNAVVVAVNRNVRGSILNYVDVIATEFVGRD